MLLGLCLVLAVLAGLAAVGGDKLVLRDGRPALVSLDGGLPEGVAFRLGEDDVTVAELEDDVSVLVGLYGISAPEEDEQADKYRRDTAKAVVLSRLLDRAARGRGISVSGQKIDEQVATLVQNAYGGDRSRFVAVLGEEGVSENDVRQEIRKQLQNLELYTQVTKEAAAPTEAEMRAYFQEHRDELVTPERRTLANIVVATREEAARIASRARAGDDFADLARRHSLDAQTKEKGGALGTLAQADLQPGYGEAAFKAARGAVFGPVETPSGWNVGVVRGIEPSRPLAYADVVEALKAKLLDDRRQELWTDYLGDILRKAEVVYADRYRPQDPDSPPKGDLGITPATTDDTTGE